MVLLSIQRTTVARVSQNQFVQFVMAIGDVFQSFTIARIDRTGCNVGSNIMSTIDLV